tara:strand:- start:199 stop:945 length:747 start_codon:yes stop_codon:yes gene_type:complete
MKSIISHFYNEEYLLPWWLNHHKKYFDYGLMINYASTDRSVEIINKICPDWKVVDSVNKEFAAKDCDEEVEHYEKKISGWKICLNITEFLVGDFSLLNTDNKNEYYIPAFYFIDDQDHNYPDKNIPLHEQLFNGIDYDDNISIRKLRCMHNSVMSYVPGRHFDNYDQMTDKFIIFNYGFAPMNEYFIQRKLQIQHRVPSKDIEQGWGWQHTNKGGGLLREDIIDMRNKYKLESKNLSFKMKKYLEFTR